MSKLARQILEVLKTLAPDSVKQIIEKGLLRALVILVVVTVVLPPAIVLLAAYWLKALGGIDNKAVTAFRSAYLEVIEDGFSIEEVATRSNVRLDYFQLFEYDLSPRQMPVKELRLSLEPRQKAAIQLRTVTFKALDATCSLPEAEADVELVTVSLGDRPIRTLRQDSDATIDIGRPWWRDNADQFGDDDLVQRLSFRLTQRAREILTCGSVHLEGSVQVFKDLLTGE